MQNATRLGVLHRGKMRSSLQSPASSQGIRKRRRLYEEMCMDGGLLGSLGSPIPSPSSLSPPRSSRKQSKGCADGNGTVKEDVTTENDAAYQENVTRRRREISRASYNTNKEDGTTLNASPIAQRRILRSHLKKPMVSSPSSPASPTKKKSRCNPEQSDSMLLLFPIIVPAGNTKRTKASDATSNTTRTKGKTKVKATGRKTHSAKTLKTSQKKDKIEARQPDAKLDKKEKGSNRRKTTTNNKNESNDKKSQTKSKRDQRKARKNKPKPYIDDDDSDDNSNNTISLQHSASLSIPINANNKEQKNTTTMNENEGDDKSIDKSQQNNDDSSSSVANADDVATTGSTSSTMIGNIAKKNETTNVRKDMKVYKRRSRYNPPNIPCGTRATFFCAPSKSGDMNQCTKNKEAKKTNVTLETKLNNEMKEKDKRYEIEEDTDKTPQNSDGMNDEKKKNIENQCNSHDQNHCKNNASSTLSSSKTAPVPIEDITSGDDYGIEVDQGSDDIIDIDDSYDEDVDIEIHEKDNVDMIWKDNYLDSFHNDSEIETDDDIDDTDDEEESENIITTSKELLSTQKNQPEQPKSSLTSNGDKKKQSKTPQRKKTIAQKRKIRGKRLTLTLVKNVSKGKKTIPLRSEVTKQQQQRKQRQMTKIHSVKKKKKPSTVNENTDDDDDDSYNSTTATTTTKIKKTTQQRNRFIGVKPTTIEIPAGTETRASLSRKLNPNLVSLLSSRSKKILETKKFYASPRPSVPVPSFSSSRAMVVHKVTPTPTSRSRDLTIFEPNTKSNSNKRRIPMESNNSETEFESSDNDDNQIERNSSPSMSALQSAALGYIDEKIKSLQKLRSQIQNYQKYKNFNEQMLNQICNDPTVTKDIQSYNLTISGENNQKDKKVNQLQMITKNAVKTSSRKAITWNRKKLRTNKSMQSTRKCIDYDQNPSHCRNHQNKARVSCTKTSGYTSSSHIIHNDDKYLDSENDVHHSFPRSIMKTNPSMIKNVEPPAMSPYGNTWLELKLNSTSSIDDDDDDDESVKNINIGMKGRIKRKVNLVESDDSQSDEDEDDSESTCSLKSDLHKNRTKRRQNTSQIDSLQFLALHTIT